MEVVVTTGAVGRAARAKLQSNHHQQQTNTQLLTGRMPFLSPINGVKALKGKCANEDLTNNYIHTGKLLSEVIRANTSSSVWLFNDVIYSLRPNQTIISCMIILQPFNIQ